MTSDIISHSICDGFLHCQSGTILTLDDLILNLGHDTECGSNVNSCNYQYLLGILKKWNLVWLHYAQMAHPGTLFRIVFMSEVASPDNHILKNISFSLLLNLESKGFWGFYYQYSLILMVFLHVIMYFTPYQSVQSDNDVAWWHLWLS